MKEFLTITVVDSGIVVTVDASLFQSANRDGKGMHAFNSIDKAIAFIRAELIAIRRAATATPEAPRYVATNNTPV